MYNSIQQFNEFGVKIIEKVIKDFINQGNNDIADLVIGYRNHCKNFNAAL